MASEATQAEQHASEAHGDSAELEAWLVDHLTKALELEPGEIEIDQPFDAYGLDSVAVVDLMGALEDRLGRELPPNLPYEHPTIAALARHLTLS